MEKKDWKERIDINMDKKPYEITLDGQPIRCVNHLEKWVGKILQQELDKAREEGMFTEDEQRVLRFALKLQRDDIHKVWDEETFGTIWKKVGGLSKLTTK